MKTDTKVVIVYFAVILIIIAAFFLWSFPPFESKEIIDTLEVSYWNPEYPYWTADTVLGPIMEWPRTSVFKYSSDSIIVVSATVTESMIWDNTTEEGREKMKTINPDHTSYASFRRECYLDVNEVLKGNYEIDRIYLKTDTGRFTVGEEYILFIGGSEVGDSYWVWGPYGYLKKEGTSYNGYGISVSEKELKSSIKLSEIVN